MIPAANSKPYFLHLYLSRNAYNPHTADTNPNMINGSFDTIVAVASILGINAIRHIAYPPILVASWLLGSIKDTVLAISTILHKSRNILNIMGYAMSVMPIFTQSAKNNG